MEKLIAYFTVKAHYLEIQSLLQFSAELRIEILDFSEYFVIFGVITSLA